MPNSHNDYKYIDEQISFLYQAASKLDGWYKQHAKSFIEVGEYALALDGIAYAYLNNDKAMPNDLFRIFENLADTMNLQADAEYEGVARLRARSQS